MDFTLTCEKRRNNISKRICWIIKAVLLTAGMFIFADAKKENPRNCIGKMVSICSGIVISILLAISDYLHRKRSGQRISPMGFLVSFVTIVLGVINLYNHTLFAAEQEAYIQVFDIENVQEAEDIILF